MVHFGVLILNLFNILKQIREDSVEMTLKDKSVVDDVGGAFG